jgi:hypothetical protein
VCLITWGSAADGEKHNWHLSSEDYGLRRGEELIWIDALDSNESFTQDCFISVALSDLKKYAQNLRQREHPIELAVHLDNLPCHNGQKAVDKMRHKNMIRLDHAPCSSDLSRCDFWLFGVLKNRKKETVFGNAGDVEDIICNSWSEVTLDEVQLAFHEWTRRFEQVCELDAGYVPE